MRIINLNRVVIVIRVIIAMANALIINAWTKLRIIKLILNAAKLNANSYPLNVIYLVRRRSKQILKIAKLKWLVIQIINF